MSTKPVKVALKPSKTGGRTKVVPTAPRQSVSRKIAARNSKKTTVTTPAKAATKRVNK